MVRTQRTKTVQVLHFRIWDFLSDGRDHNSLSAVSCQLFPLPLLSFDGQEKLERRSLRAGDDQILFPVATGFPYRSGSPEPAALDSRPDGRSIIHDKDIFVNAGDGKMVAGYAVGSIIFQ